MGLETLVVGGQHELRFETVRGAAAAALLPKEEDRSVAAATSSSSSSSGPVSGTRADVMRVLSGTAEVFGAELFAGSEYKLSLGRSYGVFSWYGCKIEVNNEFCKGVYVSEDTPNMLEIANVHAALEEKRGGGQYGPRIAVVGPPGCGKSSVSRVLARYAVRSGHKPIYVNLDVSKNDLMFPGTIAATVLREPRDLYGENFELLQFRASQPLGFFVGIENVTSNVNRFNHQVDCLTDALNSRIAEDQDIAGAGMIVDTFGWSSTSTKSSKALIYSLEKLQVEVVLVIGHDRLFADLKKSLAGQNVLKLTRSGGVAEADNTKRLAYDRMREYFYGSMQELSPVRKTLSLNSDVNIFLIKQNVIKDSSIVPIGMESFDDQSVPRMNTVDKSLESCVLAVVNTSEESEEVLSAPVAGFLHVTEVDIEANTISVDLACPAELPSMNLLHGNIKWFESD